MAHLVILGGGFGGLAAADRLRERLDDGHEITVVDRRDEFFMGFAKLWDLAGTRPLAEGTRSLRTLEDRGVRFLQAEVLEIDAAARRVTTTEGDLEADALLIALGTGGSPAQRAWLAGEAAHDLYDPASLPAMRRDLETITSGRVVVSVLGGPHRCPPAPYETALIVDQRLRERGVRGEVEVVMTTPQAATLPVAGVDASAFVAAQLGEHDVRLLTERRVDRVDPAGRRVLLADGDELDFDILLGVCADVPPPVTAACAVADDDGWIHPDPATLRTSLKRVYAVGDCTWIPSPAGALPKAGAFAAAEGVVAADNMLADLGLGAPATFDGHGACFLELPGERVAMVEGDFLADPPDVTLTEPDHEHFRRKQEYERQLLDRWLG
jgi:sulfide:quinone oxidoreductase